MPLFAIGIASFAISYFIFHDLPGSGAGHVPLWSVFSAAGVMIIGGGAAVIVVGGEPGDPPYDSSDVVVLSKGEYGEMLEKVERLTEYESAPLRMPARLGGPPRSVPFSAGAVRPSARVDSEPLNPLPKGIAAPPMRPPGDFESGVGPTREDITPEASVEPVWKESPEPRKASRPRAVPGLAEFPSPTTSSGRSPPAAPRQVPKRPSSFDPTFERTLNELEAALDSLSTGEAKGPAQAQVERATSPPPSPSQSDETRRRPLSTKAISRSRTVCTTCGTRVEDRPSAARCEVCEESLCAPCQIRAEYEGHAHTCARCQGILSLAEEDGGS